MENPKVSIIVPVYNVEKYLSKCLDSLVNQSFKNIEILIINDGSTDSSQSIINDYHKRYPHLIKFYLKDNGGLSSARNYGIEHALGEYLLFVDSDDYLHLDAVKKLYNKAYISNSDIICFNYIEDREGVLKKVITFDNRIQNMYSKYLLSKPSACIKFCKKKLFLELSICFLEDVYYEDLATMPLLIMGKPKITFINEDLYFYYVREGSILNEKNFNPKFYDIFKVLEYLEKVFKQHKLSVKYLDEIEYLYIEHLLRATGIRFLRYPDKKTNISKIVETMKEKFPNWKNNKYFKRENIKKKIMCKLIFCKQFFLIRILRKL